MAADALSPRRVHGTDGNGARCRTTRRRALAACADTPSRPAETTQRGAVEPKGPSLPHERDQQTDATHPDIQRAAKGLKQGQVDTDLRGDWWMAESAARVMASPGPAAELGPTVCPAG